MYLKRLEAQGFKSFANRTVLEFTPGVTCVVGPNGTGKTNVADSLRWVLGEHASRMLRARKTEDVIFAGSDKRAPMGAAEVSITLDNSGGWLPVDFSEVVVTRRAYRSGDNEYLINNAKVRLRDVIELFQRAQVGQNSYAFMGQGMVEQVLSLRPEDRRGLIEEAADVRLYRNRLEDARNKLKATRENMDRVRLLVREIEPRITQLERQAGRAVRYQELAGELATTLHAWFAHQWRDLNEQVLAAITTQDQRSGELEEARAAASACEHGLDQLRKGIEERSREIAVRDERLRSVEDYVRDLERRAALDGERVKMLSQRIEELAGEIETLRGDVQLHSREVDPNADSGELEAKIAIAEARQRELRDRVGAIESELLGLERASAADEQEAQRARTAAEALQARIAEAHDAVRALDAQRTEASTREGEAKAALTTWAQEFARLVAVVARAREEEGTAMRRHAQASAAMVELRREQAERELSARTLRAQAEASRMRAELLAGLDAPVPPPDAGIRSVLEAGGVLRRDAPKDAVVLEGVRGLVGQVLRVPPGLERAIEAALADNLFAVIVERHIDLRAAVDLLLAGNEGRATIYALDSFQETRPLHLIKEKGVVGVASALVRCDSRYRRLVDTLLGRTIVVENAQVGARIIKRGLANAVATLDGVLMRPVGSVSAGTPRSVEAALQRQREAAEAPADVEAHEKLATEAESALAEAHRRLDEAERRAVTSDAALTEARERRLQAEAARTSGQGRLAQLRATLVGARAERARLDADITRAQQEAARLDDERAARLREALAADERSGDARRRLSEQAAVGLQASETLAEQAQELASLEADLRSMRLAGAPDQTLLERLRQQLAAREQQHARLTAEQHEITARLAATERELATKSAEAQGVRDELAPARSELTQLESRERTMTAELVEANARSRETERALLEAQQAASLRRDELHELRQQLHEEGFITTDDGDVARAPVAVAEEPEPAPAQDEQQEGDVPRWLRDDGDPDLPPIRGGSAVNPTELRDRIADLRAQIRALGPVNEQAATDYTENRERYDFLSSQLTDLQQAEEQLRTAVDELESIIRERFRSTFKVVNREFERYFAAFFRGGTARLELGETDENGLPGIEIIAQPPGKKLGSLALLSGGERSLTAVALLFALLSANPSPICVLDEVDAALDEANVGRFVEELRDLAQRTQFIIITHNRRTIENADTIYGVSMGADNVSRVLSLKLSEVKTAD